MVLVNVSFSALFWLSFERAALQISHRITLSRPQVQARDGSTSYSSPNSLGSMDGLRNGSPSVAESGATPDTL
jgi:hypothetical protein